MIPWIKPAAVAVQEVPAACKRPSLRTVPYGVQATGQTQAASAKEDRVNEENSKECEKHVITLFT